MTDQAQRSPMVTIGMPVYNGSTYIREAIQSALAQTLRDFELVISDNCSTDDTAAICEEYCQRDSRVRYVRQEVNRGAYWNFSHVVGLATGQYFTWLAHDDMLEPTFLETCVDFLQDRPHTALVSGDFIVIADKGQQQGTEMLSSIRETSSWSDRRTEFFKYPISNVFYCIYGLYRTSACREVFAELTAPKVLTGSELPVLSRIAVRGAIASVPFKLRKYRSHSNSAYMLEFSQASRSHPAARTLGELRRLYGLRFDQLRVLIHSNLSPTTKISIIHHVLICYMRAFLKKVMRTMQPVFRSK